MSLTDDYLAELGRKLPAGSRRRILSEVEEHLRESAAVHGEEEALARFGPARDLARPLARTAAARAALRFGILLLPALAASAVAASGLIKDLLPPWGAIPLELSLEGPFPFGKDQDAVMLLFSVSGILCAGGIAAGALRRVRIALPLLAAGLVVLAALTVVLASLAVHWERVLPAAHGAIWIAAYVLVQASALAGAAVFAGRATLAQLAAR